MDLLRNTGTGIIHRPACGLAKMRGIAVLVPWLMAKDLDEGEVARLSEQHSIHLCRCLEPVRCRCHGCAPVESRP